MARCVSHVVIVIGPCLAQKTQKKNKKWGTLLCRVGTMSVSETHRAPRHATPLSSPRFLAIILYCDEPWLLKLCNLWQAVFSSLTSANY